MNYPVKRKYIICCNIYMMYLHTNKSYILKRIVEDSELVSRELLDKLTNVDTGLRLRINNIFGNGFRAVSLDSNNSTPIETFIKGDYSYVQEQSGN